LPVPYPSPHPHNLLPQPIEDVIPTEAQRSEKPALSKIESESVVCMGQRMIPPNSLYLFHVVVLQRSRKHRKKAFVVILRAAKDPEELNFTTLETFLPRPYPVCLYSHAPSKKLSFFSEAKNPRNSLLLLSVLVSQL